MTLVWDASTSNPTDGPQDGNGTWDSTTANWWNSAIPGDQAWTDSTIANPVFAQFGAGTAAATRQVTVSGTFHVAGLNFAAIPGTISTSNAAYNLVGTGTIDLGANGTINIADGTSSSSSLLTIGTTLTGSDVTIQKSGGTAEQFLSLTGTNQWTGTLTIANNGHGSLFVRSTGTGDLNTLDTVVVQSGDTLNLQVQGANTTYTSNYVVAGPGSPTTNSRGAIRFESNMTLSGNVTLAGNTVLNFQSATPTAANVTFQKGIGEQGGSWSFTKTGLGQLILQGASTYSGSTIIAPAGSGIDPGSILLDFLNVKDSTTDNLLYNGVTPGALVLTGNPTRANTSSTATLAIQGSTDFDNSQSFSSLTVSGPTALTFTSSGNAINVSLGSITRTGVGTTLAITAASSGAVTTTTNVGTLLGTWATYTDPTNQMAWAGSDDTGTLTFFGGDLLYTTGTNIGALPGYSANSNLAITNLSSGPVTQGSGTTTLNTITMEAVNNDRVVTVGAGNTLALGQTGGIQLITGSRSLTIGAPGNAGTLTAGTAANAELFLSNFDSLNTITINSVIANNSVGAVNVVVNGLGTTILTVANTYTGTTTISSGLLEIENASGLGTGSTAISVGPGGALALGNGITLSRNISLTGTGVGNLGALRSMSGDNTYNGVITVTGATSITADAGSTLTLFHTSPTTSVISENLTPAQNVTFGGAGTIFVNSQIGISGAGIVKTDSGTLVLSVSNPYTGSTTITGGILRITNAGALGGTGSGTTVNSGGTLELTNNLIVGAEALGLNGTGANNIGALHSVGNNSYAGKITLGSAARINSDSGTLTLNSTTGISGAFGLTFGGTGDIVVTQPIATGTGSLTKDDTGTLTLATGNTYTGGTTMSGGTIAMTGSDTFADSGALTLDGGVLAMGAFNDTVGAVTLRSGAITGTGTLTSSSTSTSAFSVQDGSISVNLTDATATAGLVKSSSNTVVLSGTNTYTGTTTINSGRLVLDYSGGATVLPTTDAVNLSGGGLEVLGGSSPKAITLGVLQTTANSGLDTLTVDANTALTMASFTRGSGTALLIDLSAPGSSLAFTTAAGGVNGVITGAAGGGNAAVTVKDSSGRYDFAAPGAGNTITSLKATTSLPASGSSSAANYILPANGNTLALSASETVGTLRIDTTAAGGTLDLNGKTLSFNLLGFLMDGSNDFTITNTGTGGGLTGLNGVFIYQYGTGKLTLNAPVTGPQTFFMGTGLIDWTGAAGNAGANWLLGLTLRLDGTGMTSNNSVPNGNGTGVLNLGNNGILELTSSDFTRAVGSGNNLVTFLAGGGGFSAFGADRAVNLGGAGAALTWGSGGFLASGNKLILGSPYANATVDFQNPLNLNGGNQTVEVQSPNITGVGGKISGAITGTGGSLSKTGQGILNLSGANTYTGQTFVKAGTLLVSGSISGSSAVNVSSGAELKLTGAGTVTAGTLGLSDSSKLSLEVGSLTATTISLTGNASLSGTITLALTLTNDPVDGTLFTLIDGASPLTGYDSGGRFAANGTPLNDGATFNVTSGAFSQNFIISYDGGADGNDVTILAVPEPSSLLTLTAALGFTLGLTRLRRRSRPHLTAVA
ncbi:beta strand repeat-containing protein [Chthoniobacter flavus]|nr:autotransporter-associated beta strand repeat-containing protein [Chthoniobacter flavus]